jgi:hypothetical protein
MWQQVIVGVIVAVALLHFVTKYMPAALRRQIVYVLSRRGYNQSKLAKLFNTQSSCGSDGGCSSCGSCETDSTPPADTSAPMKRVIKLHVQR